MEKNNHGLPPPATGADDVPVNRVKHVGNGNYDDSAEMDPETGLALSTNPMGKAPSPFGNLGPKGGRGV